MWTQLRIGILGAVLGGLAIGGVTLWKDREPAPRPEPEQMPVPMAEVPGYEGPVYDANGRLVGYALPEAARTQQAPAAAAAPAPAPTAAPRQQPRGRSTAKSAAIVGGSAGAGAAIGALAGGGKGAAIGAISGGTAGFIYDRHTHKKPR